MNESVVPGWFMNLMIVFALVHLLLLVWICLLIQESAHKLSKTLHWIESHTRHTAEAVGYTEEEEASNAR